MNDDYIHKDDVMVWVWDMGLLELEDILRWVSLAEIGDLLLIQDAVNKRLNILKRS